MGFPSVTGVEDLDRWVSGYVVHGRITDIHEVSESLQFCGDGGHSQNAIAVTNASLMASWFFPSGLSIFSGYF